MIYIFLDFGSKTALQQNASIGLSIGVALLCFGLPYYVFRYLKEIEVKNGVWTISYPNLKKSLQLTKHEIRKVEILKTHRTGKQINLRLNNRSSIYISESQIRNFGRLAKLASENFKELVHRTD